MNQKYAILFPGQGSQYPGMAKDIYEEFENVRELFEKAERITGISLKKIMFTGLEEELRKTYITQPAIFLHSMVVWELVKHKLQEPAFVAGHSLGEFSALCCAGVWNFEDALRIVAERGKLMYEAGKTTEGTMAAIIGLSEKTIKEICNKIEDLYLVNLNSPSQFVISGKISAVEKGIEEAKNKGAKRAVRLAVSGAFHTPFLNEAKEKFSKFLDEIEFRKPKFSVIMNVTGKPTDDVEEIKKNVKVQLTSPVQWIKTMNVLKENEILKSYELGPGKVLCGLLKRTHSEIECIPIGDVESIKQLISLN